LNEDKEEAIMQSCKLLATRFTALKQKYILPIISLFQQHAKLAANSL